MPEATHQSYQSEQGSAMQSQENFPDNANPNVEPWQQPGLLTQHGQKWDTALAGMHHGHIGSTIPKAPYAAYEQEEHVQQERESIFHPVKAFNDALERLDKMIVSLEKLINLMLLERTFEDELASIGVTVNYIVAYHDRKYLYVLTNAATTFVYPGGTVGPTTAGRWFPISLPRGTSLTIQGGSDTTPQVCTFRHCDVIMN